MRLVFTVALCLTLGACGTGRLLSYGGQTSDATVRLGPATFRVYVHPQDDTLLVQRALSQTTTNDSANLIGIVSDQFLAPVDCRREAPSLISAGSWEVPFTCPREVNLRALVAEQRDALKDGAPIQP